MISPSLGAFFLLVLALLAVAASLWKRRKREQGLSLFLLGLLLFGEALLGYCFPGRAVLGFGLFQPGSAQTRLLDGVLPSPLSAIWLHTLNPSFFILCFLLAKQNRLCRCSLIVLLSAFACELIAMRALFLARGVPSLLSLSHLVLLLLGGLFLFFGLLQSFARADADEPVAPRIPWLFAVALLTLILFSFGLQRLQGPERETLALAHYYSWFPENWKSGFLGEKLNPVILPKLGQYKSGAEELVHAHAEMARAAGIDCFILDWWPTRGWVRDRALLAAKQFSEREHMCTVLLYETLDLRQPHEGLTAGERENIVYLSPERAKGMGAQWARMVEDYMRRPGYLRWSGRPVLYLYATRHLVGDVAAGIELAREIVRQKTGEELFLIGDEIYYEVPQGDKNAVRLSATYAPNWDRLRAFDAITAYNPFDNSRKQHAGQSGVLRFLSDGDELFRRYRVISAELGIPFIPMALAGYNDRGHRLEADNFVVPRILPNGESLFARTLATWVRPHLDQGQAIFAITSWNEWNEGSQIEPTGEGGMSTASPELGQGESYQAYGKRYLGELCSFLSGRDTTRHCGEYKEK